MNLEFTEEEAAEYAREAYEKPEERNIENQEIIANYPTLFAVKHPSKGIVISHRGTQDTSDYIADFYMLIGGTSALKNTEHYKHAKRITEWIHKNYPTEKITHIGHSLGGTTAHFLSHERNEPSIAFNPGSSPVIRPGSTIGENIIHHAFKKSTANKKQRVIRIPSDIFSITFKGGEYRKGKKDLDPHSIDNFLKS